MSQVFLDIATSLDGFVAGPNSTLDAPLGEGGDRLHRWKFALECFRQPHGLPGGETNADSAIVDEILGSTGATVMGRRMFSGGEGPWEDDPNADGWFGEEPPFHHPVFVVTHHARDPIVSRGTTFTFVTDGVEEAVEQAREAAGELDVAIGGGADLAQQCLRAGLLDELQIHVAPVLLGGWRRLFDGGPLTDLDCTRILASPSGVAHLTYRRDEG